MFLPAALASMSPRGRRVAPSGGGGGSSALAALAASLSAGQWGTLTMSNLGDSVWIGGGDSFLSFGPIGQWDELHDRLVYIGATHPGAGAYETREFYCDTASGEAWVRNDTNIPPGDGGPDHGYYHFALDPATGDRYRKQYGADSVARRAYASSSWSALSAPPLDDWNLAVGGLVWHPGLYSGGGGVILATYEGFCSYNPSTTSWTTLRNSPGTFSSGMTNMAAVYNRADQCAYFFGDGGSWKITAAGTVSSVTGPPVGVAMASVGSGCHVFSSTGSNRMVALATATSGKTIYEYNHSADSWASIGSYSWSYSNSFAGFTCDSLGVLLFIMTTSGNSMGTTAQVWKR